MHMMKTQQGHAAILFAMMIPVLFGVFMIGSDGARAVQDKARLNEALEVASLAVSAQASSNSSTRASTAASYIQYFFPSADVSTDDISVTVTTCNPESTVDGCNSDSLERYFNYEVTGTITQDSWFPGNNVIAGFGDDYDVGSYSSSRKYQSEAIDVMLVSDFSASMYQTWEGGENRKFEDVMSIWLEIADVIRDYNSTISEDSNKSTIGVSGYDFYTKTNDGNFAGNIYCDKHRYYYKKNNKYYYTSYSVDSEYRCESFSPDYPEYNELNVEKTIEKIFLTTDGIHSSGWSQSEVTNISKFTNIALTSDYDTFKNSVSTTNFNITKGEGSGTFSPAGVIRGAQLLNEGSNSKRLLIVLSDGGDSYTNNSSDPDENNYHIDNFSDQLYNAGLCTSIRENFTKDDIDITMAVIGFDYVIDDFPQLSTCVGEDNVYQAENSEEIENTILSLITEEIGHLAIGTE